MAIEDALTNFTKFPEYLLNFANLNSEQITEFSIQIIIIAIIIIVIALIIFSLKNKKSKEEKTAKHLLKNIEKMRLGDTISNKPIDLDEQFESKKERLNENKEKQVEKKENTVVKVKEEKDLLKPTENSLKEMLIKKFKPKIEAQLQTKLTIIDFNAKESNFVALIEVDGTRLSLTLDSSGKIIDYKKL